MDSTSEHVTLQVRESAYNRRIHTFAVVNNQHLDIQQFMNDAFHIYQSELVRTLEQHNNIVKTMSILVAEFEKNIPTMDENGVPDGGERTIKETLYFTTPNMTIGLGVDLNEHYQKNIVEEISKSVENTAIQGSGFTLSRIIELDVQVCSYEPLGGASYIETPQKLKHKKALVNVINENDNMCFKWSVLSALHPTASNPHRLQHYLKYENELNFDGIDFPVRLNQIDKFTHLNDTISINVYYYDDVQHRVCPLRVSSDIKKHHIHLLLLTSDEKNQSNKSQTTASKIKTMLDNKEAQMHYCWIKNLSRLVSGQLSKHEHKSYICDRCLNFYDGIDKLNRHMTHCTNEYQIEMPDENTKWIEFNHPEYQLKAPFTIYADTEALLKRLDAEERKRVFSEGCSTNAYQEHHVYSVGYYFKCEFDDSKSYYASSSGNDADCIKWFVQELENIAQNVAEMLSVNQPMVKLNMDEERSFRDPEAKCSICGNHFESDEMRVHDHCHFTGKFRGAAHNICNLNYIESRTIPVVMHNLSGYDAHLFIKELALQVRGDTSIIPINAEQYISFTKVVWNSTMGLNMREKIKLKFIDSFRFMPASLSHLASLIPSDKKRILHSECERDYTSEQIIMLERKGVFPYDYVDNYDRLSETSLPSKEHFYSELNDEEISSEEYEFACCIWEKFQIKTLREYSDLYLKTDVLLLADVFENFRDTCHAIYKLDPAHYYTAPGLSFDAMLKYTDVKIELLTDVEMLMFVESGIRGGISQCSKRHVKANNKYMKVDFKPDEKSNYLMYLDANNLYGHAMSQPLPIGEYEWVDNDVNIDQDNDDVDMMQQSSLFSDVNTILNLSDDSDTGYIFEVDLHYPEDLHHAHNDFPFCAEKRTLPDETFDIIGVKRNKIKKLLLTLCDKEKYVVHYRMLKLALRHGLVLKKVHRILKFKQSLWLKPYIDLNTELRKKATNDFEKSFFKLLNNAIFGKTMENIRSRVDIKLVSKWDGRCGARMLIARPNFKQCRIFDEQLVAIEMRKTHILMNKPIAVSMTVLDLSKVTMYSFLYDFLKPKYNDKVQVAYTDTDSFILDIETSDFYEDIRNNITRFDTSDYPWPNDYDIERKNKKVPGLFKDELNGRIMTEFVGLRAKCYAVRSLDGKSYNENMKKAKGVKKSVLRRKITFNDYVKCIENNCEIKKKQNTIRSIKHNVYSIQQEKVALSPFDDKRYLIKPNRIDTLAWGHYAIDMHENIDHD